MYANARPGGSLEALSKDLLRQARQLADGGQAEDELLRVKKVSPGAEFILPRCHAPPAVPPPDSYLSLNPDIKEIIRPIICYIIEIKLRPIQQPNGPVCWLQRYRVEQLQDLASNSNMAGTLASYSALTGDWCVPQRQGCRTAQR